MRTVYPPPATGNAHNQVQQVRLSNGETVAWHWHHTPDGSFVTGYTILKEGEDKVKWIICKKCQRDGAYPLSEKAIQHYMKLKRNENREKFKIASRKSVLKYV